MIKIEITAETVGEIHGELQTLLQGIGSGPVVSGADLKAGIEKASKSRKKTAEPEQVVEEPSPKADDSTPKQETTPEPQPSSGVTYDQVKEMALQKARAKKKEEVKAILADAGVVRISDLKQSQYAEVFEQLEKL